MSIASNGSSRSRVFLLAILMVTSSFAAIGMSTAGPTGMESVMWYSAEGYSHTDANGGMVHAYNNTAEVGMDFISIELADNETYVLELMVWHEDESGGMPVSYDEYEWVASDMDGDGVVDPSTEMLNTSAIVDDACYDVQANLFIIDAAMNRNHLSEISQLFTVGNESACEIIGSGGPMEWVGVIYGPHEAGIHGIPHFNTTADVSVQATAEELDLNASYYFEVQMDEWDENGTSWGQSTVGTGISGQATYVEDLTGYIVHDGCYSFSVYLSDYDTGDPISEHLGEQFTVGDEEYCEDIGGQGGDSDPMIYVWTENDYNLEGEEILAWFDVMDLNATMDYEVVWGLEQFLDTGDVESVLSSAYAITAASEDWRSQLMVDSTGADLTEGCYVVWGAIIETSTGYYGSNDSHEFLVDDPDTEGPDCGYGGGPGDAAYVEVDKPFDPWMGLTDTYSEGEDVTATYGLWGALADTNYSGMILVHLEHMDDEGGEKFTCDDGEEIPAEWENDGMEDCADGSDENDGGLGGENGTEQGGDHEGLDEFIASAIHMVDAGTFLTGADGDYVDALTLSPDVFDVGIYTISFIAIQYDDEGDMADVQVGYALICYADPMCDYSGEEFDFHSYIEGSAQYEMYFEHFDYWEDDEESFGANNGLLELVSARQLSVDIRAYIDDVLGDGDGNVDIYEAEAFSIMMNQDPDEGPGMCPFDETAADSPCNQPECDPEGIDHDEDACEQIVVEYCANNPGDEACDMGGPDECPFDPDAADSPCQVEACDPNGPNHNQTACDQAVQDYCSDNPNDEGCSEGMGGEDKAAGEEGGTEEEEGKEDDDEGGNLLVELDGNNIGEPHHRWFWIDNLWGPVDGSDGLALTFINGMIWELDLGSWADADSHTVTLSEDDGKLIDPCGDGEALSGEMIVHDSYSWTPEEPDMPDGWTVTTTENGYGAAFDCNSDVLKRLTVFFTKTIDDYNGDNFDDEDYGGEGDVDMPTNSPPECYVYAIIDANGNMSDAEESFSAPDGDHTLDLDPGHYFLHAGCMDADGDMVSASLTAAGGTLDFLAEGEGEVSYEFTLIAGMPDISITYDWASAGGHMGSGTITVHVNDVIDDNNTSTEPIVNDDGTLSCPTPLILKETTNADGTTTSECVAAGPDDVGELTEEALDEGSGILPGFSGVLSITAMLGAIFVLGRRRVEL